MEPTILNVADFIKRYKNVSNIKFTLGKYTEQFGFEKHLFQKEKYQCILNLLNSNSQWEDKNETILTKNNKIPYKIIDTITYKIKNSPYDLIITAESKKSQEFYISEEYIKKEVSFTRKCHIFQISYENSVQYGDVFNFNLIFSKNENTDTYNSHSSLLKIIDIIKAVDTNNTVDYVFEKL
tara:strand:- start:1450 stop:1992 length:543 start_codon:yes stop_codon:yes gene_type:complete